MEIWLERTIENPGRKVIKKILKILRILPPTVYV